MTGGQTAKYTIEINKLLSDLGVNPKYKGHSYLNQIFLYLTEQELKNNGFCCTKIKVTYLYLYIGKKINKDDSEKIASNVEHNIRVAISAAQQSGKELFKKLFPIKEINVTNGEFIYEVYQYFYNYYLYNDICNKSDDIEKEKLRYFIKETVKEETLRFFNSEYCKKYILNELFENEITDEDVKKFMSSSPTEKIKRSMTYVIDTVNSLVGE